MAQRTMNPQEQAEALARQAYARDLRKACGEPGEVIGVRIQVRQSNEYVEIFTNDLPDDVQELVDILKAELAPLRQWLQLAVAYYRQGKVNQFVTLLETASDEAIETLEGYQYESVHFERIAVLNALGSHYVAAAAAETRDGGNPSAAENAIQLANGYFDRAIHIDMSNSASWVCRGVFLLLKKTLQSAVSQFEQALSIDSTCFSAILGLACINFHLDNFVEARKRYVAAIRMHPGCDASVRVGLGLSLYRLGHHEAAKKAMARALELQVCVCVSVSVCVARACSFFLLTLDTKPRVGAAARQCHSAGVCSGAGAQPSHQGQGRTQRCFVAHPGLPNQPTQPNGADPHC